MVDTLKEIDNMLDSELPIKHTANLIEILNGFSSDTDFCSKLVSEYPFIVTKLLKNGVSIDALTKPVFEFLINLFAQPGVVFEYEKSGPHGFLNFSDFFGVIVHLVNHSPAIFDRALAAQLLSNITREKTDFFEEWITLNHEEMMNLLKVGLFISCKNDEELKDDVIMVILNLSQEVSCQKFVMNNLHCLNEMVNKFDSYSSEHWMVSIIGLIKNLLKNSEFHLDLLEKVDLLTILLHRLVGLHQYEEKIWNEFPNHLKRFVNNGKECSADLRCLILEAVYLLSATKYGRIRMRDSNVYDILKNISELDLSNEESNNCLDCIGLLIRTEEEIGCDDLLKLKIPQDVEEKLRS